MDCLAALCQLSPALGDLDRNLEAHHRWLDRALEAGAELVIFPELSLHGYFLRDLTQEVAVGLDHPGVRALVERSKDCSILFGLAEESPEHRWFNSVVFAEDGKILHVHRKVHLPDYGLFEEGRYFAHGDRFDTVRSRRGHFGLLVCEDAWHFSSGWLHFLAGVDALLIPSAGPARGVDTADPELSSQSSWRTLAAAHALFFQCWVVHCNRVGFEEGAQFWGGSSVHTPFAKIAAEAQGQEEELLLQQLTSGPLRRARMMSPLRRDARPGLVRRQLARLLEDPDALRGAEAEASAERDRTPPPRAMSTLPPPPGCNCELATRVLTAFLREETRKVGFERAVLGLSGGIDSALVVELAARALGPEQVLAVAMPYRTSNPLSLELAQQSAAHAGVGFEVTDISAAADALINAQLGLADDDSEGGRLRKGNIMARVRMIVLYDRSARDTALVYGTSNKTELLLGYGTIHGDMASALNPIGDLYKSQVFALSRHLGVPQGIIDRPPSADLWEGQTDEQELGLRYDDVDAFLHHAVDRRYARQELITAGFPAALIDRLQRRVRINQYKRRPPLIAKVANRTINLDYRYARDWGA